MMQVSIIVRAYNAERTIDRAVRSALALDFPQDAYEVIVVDDGSKDGTAAALEKYAADPRVRIIRQENRGAIPAANVGFKTAKGEYVTLLDADDEYMPNFLHDAMNVAHEHPDFIYCDYFEELEGVRKEVEVADIFKATSVGTLYNREKFEAEGLYDEGLLFAEHAVMLKTFGRWKGIRIAKPLFIYHRSRTSLTGASERVEKELAKLRDAFPEREREIKLIRSYTF